jgi:uncharacterized protein
MNNLIEKAKSFVKSRLGKEPTGHDYHHALRVYDMAMYLSVGKETDIEVIGLAALLHDLEDEKITSEKQIVEKFLKQEEVSESKIKRIMNIIENMSFRDHLQGKSVITLEGKIVQDADRLDALGAIGIARTFSYGGNKSRMIYNNRIDDETSVAHFYQKLFLLPELMNLDESRNIAEERVEFMRAFLNKFYEEWKI